MPDLRYIKQVNDVEKAKIKEVNFIREEPENNNKNRNSILINGKELVNPNGTINLNVFLEEPNPQQENQIETLDE